MNFYKCCLIFWITLIVLSCGDNHVPTPKPRAYPRIEFPERKIVKTGLDQCPYSFEIPSYISLNKDKFFLQGETPNDCWFNLDLGVLNGTIHCSYYKVNDQKQLNRYINDAYKLAGKHNGKANYIDENIVKNSKNVSGVIFDIEGPVASQFQFYLTDSTNHFIRGALYFNSKTNPDSMAPILEFVKHDVAHLINTFSWK